MFTKADLHIKMKLCVG